MTKVPENIERNKLINPDSSLAILASSKNDEMNIVKLVNDKIYSMYENMASKKLSCESLG